MKAKIAKYGLTAAQLGFSFGSKATKKFSTTSKDASVMYRTLDGKTWSGAARGRKPQWVIDALAGDDIEKYRVK